MQSQSHSIFLYSKKIQMMTNVKEAELSGQCLIFTWKGVIWPVIKGYSANREFMLCLSQTLCERTRYTPLATINCCPSVFSNFIWNEYFVLLRNSISVLYARKQAVLVSLRTFQILCVFLRNKYSAKPQRLC